MSALGPFAIPILAVGAFAATLGWFGYQHMTRDSAPKQTVAVESSAGAPSGPAKPEGAAPVRPSGGQEGGKAPQSTPPRATSGASQGSGAEAPAPIAPAFDVVRVEPTGETVVAGRAAPGASVELLMNGSRHSRVVADPSGLFALVPEPLPPGEHELILQVTNGDGSRVRSPQSVTVVVAANRTDAPLVTITSPGQPAVVLSRPDGATSVAGAKPADVPGGVRPGGTRSAAASAPAGPASEPAKAETPSRSRRSVQIVSVEAEGAGRFLVAGSAAPAAIVRLYLNDTFVAPASAGPDGRIAFAIERGMQPGAYKVRLDDVDPVSGQVRSRAEVPFQMPHQAIAAATPGGPREEPAKGAAPAGRFASAAETGTPPRQSDAASRESAPDIPIVIVPEINTATVSRGDSLWAISKRTYGEGLRYTVIYGANAQQIRDPNLIYPGQLFVLPVPAREAGTR